MTVSQPEQTPETPRTAKEDPAWLRMMALSDGVFAIAMTLLVLDIRVPELGEYPSDAAIFSALVAIWPKYLGYAISFIVIGSYWLGHLAKYRQISRVDRRLMFANLLFLMVVAFIPFPTAVLTDYSGRTPTIFYAATIVVAGVLSMYTWWYAYRQGFADESHISEQDARRRLWQLAVTPAVFLVSIGIAFFDADLAMHSWLVLAAIGAGGMFYRTNTLQMPRK